MAGISGENPFSGAALLQDRLTRGGDPAGIRHFAGERRSSARPPWKKRADRSARRHTTTGSDIARDPLDANLAHRASAKNVSTGVMPFWHFLGFDSIEF
jgi:hypothetical protein